MSPYTQDISGCLESVAGANGLSASELQIVIGEAREALSKLQQAIITDELPFASFPGGTDELADQIEQTYERLADGARTIMFFGCGEAGLISQAIAQFGGWGIPGVMLDAQRKRPVTRFYSNPDPVTMAGALARSDLEKTRFIFVSKSGDVSTVCQALAAIEAVRQSGHGDQIPHLFLTITGNPQSESSNGLHRLSQHLDIPCLEFPAGKGERFAALTVAGLLPAIARGLNIRDILDGAKAVIAEAQLAENTEVCGAAQAAAVAVGLARYHACSRQVFMPFDDRLAEFASLWALLLSAGQGGTDGKRAAGVSGRALDHHSLLQSLAEAAQPNYLTLIQTSSSEAGVSFSPDLAAVVGLESFAGRTLNDLASAQQQTVATLLQDMGQPVRVLKIPELNATVLGALSMQMMLEAVLTAYMLNRDPFQSSIAQRIDHGTIQAVHD